MRTKSDSVQLLSQVEYCPILDISLTVLYGAVLDGTLSLSLLQQILLWISGVWIHNTNASPTAYWSFYCRCH